MLITIGEGSLEVRERRFAVGFWYGSWSVARFLFLTRFLSTIFPELDNCR